MNKRIDANDVVRKIVAVRKEQGGKDRDYEENLWKLFEHAIQDELREEATKAFQEQRKLLGKAIEEELDTLMTEVFSDVAKGKVDGTMIDPVMDGVCDYLLDAIENFKTRP